MSAEENTPKVSPEVVVGEQLESSPKRQHMEPLEKEKEVEKDPIENAEALTSIRVFRLFLKRVVNPTTGEMEIDANDVISPQCYDMWLSKRRQRPQNPEKSFQRSLSAHITGKVSFLFFFPN